MTDEKGEVNKSKKGRLLKKLAWILIGSAGVCLLIFFAAPLYLSSAGGTNLLLGKINDAVGGQVTVDDLSVGWFKGVELTNLSYVDEANLSAVHIRQIKTQPKYTSLLSSKIRLGKTVIDSPEVHLKIPAGPIAAGEKEITDSPAKVESKQIDLQMDLEVIDGAATIEVAGPNPQTLELKNIASRVILGQAGKASSVELSAMVDETGAIAAKGRAKPAENGWMVADGDFSVQISKLELASLKPLFAMAGKDMDMAGQLNADATVRVSGGQLETLAADAVIDHFAQGAGDQRVTFDKPVALSAKTSGSGQTLRIESLDVNSDFCRISCSGTMQQLDYSVDADLAQSLALAGQFKDLQGLSAAGHVAAAGKVNLSDKRVAVSSEAKVQQLVIAKDAVKTPATDAALSVQCALDQAANQLQISSLDLKATPGTAAIRNLTLPLSGDLQAVSLNAQTKLDLAKTWPFVQVFAEVPQDLTLAGMLDAAVQVSTQGSQVRLSTQQTQVQKLKITRGDGEPFEQNVITLSGDIVMDMEAKRVLDIRDLVLTGSDGQPLMKVNKGTLDKEVQGNSTRLNGEFEAAYDWKTVSALGAAYLPKGLTLEGRRQDAFQFESVYPTAAPQDLTKHLNAKATIGFDKAAYNGLTVGKTEMTLNVAGGVAEFAIPQASVNAGTLRFAATVDLNEENKVLRLKEPMQVLEKINLNNDVTQSMLMYLSPMFARQSNISGLASLKCSELVIPFDAAQKDAMVVDGVVQMDQMRLQAVGVVGDILSMASQRSVFDARMLPSRIVLRNGVMQYESMEFELDEYPVGFKGKILLDNNRLDMQALVPYKLDVQELRFDSIKVGQGLSERLTLPVKGDVTNPQVVLKESFDAMLKQAAPQLIEQGLKKLLDKL